MKFEEKISGTRVTEFEITPIFDSEIVTLNDVIERVHRQETMNFILDELRFYKSNIDKVWYTTIDWDTILKLSVLENYPEYEKEFVEYFGTNWLHHYIRFNH